MPRKSKPTHKVYTANPTDRWKEFCLSDTMNTGAMKMSAQPTAEKQRLPYVWDYNIDESTFRALIEGKLELGRLDRDWAALRLLEYGSYGDILSFLGFATLIKCWPNWRDRIRSERRKRGFDFLVTWLPQHHPELIKSGDGDVS